MRTLIIFSLLGSFAQAGDWPAWRGPTADGVAADSNVPLNWSPDLATWKTKIPGIGYSSPIIRGNKIVLTSSGVESSTDRCVICVNFETGKIEWTTSVFDSPVEEMHRLNSPASSTPACDHEHIYVTFTENGYVGVAALDFNGKLIWKKRPGSFLSRHGFHSCPVVHGGVVIVNGEQDGDDAFVAALDCQSGDVIWKTERPNKVRSFSAPFILTVNKQTQVVVSGANHTIAYHIADGKEIWRTDGPAGKTVSSMLTDGKLLFVPGGREDLLLAIDPSGYGDITETHIAWKGQKGIPYVPSPVLANGLLHMVSDEGVYTCYDAATGDVVKQTRAAGRTSSSLLLVRDHLLLTEDSGVTHVLKSDGSGEEVHRNELNETTYASLCVSRDSLIVRTVGHLMQFSPGIKTTSR